MSHETKSPGMRALESVENFAGKAKGDFVRILNTPEARESLAAIIERETGGTELRQDLKAVSHSFDVAREELQRVLAENIELGIKADELAKALEEMISRDDRHFYDGPTPIWITEAHAALAAYRKDKP